MLRIHSIWRAQRLSALEGNTPRRSPKFGGRRLIQGLCSTPFGIIEGNTGRSERLLGCTHA